MSKKIAVVVGSIRQNSYSQQLAQNLIGLLPEAIRLSLFRSTISPSTIRTMTAPNPAKYTVFRDQIRSADAVLFVTPEHNRSFPQP